MFLGFVLLGIGRAKPNQEKLWNWNWVVERTEILEKFPSLFIPLFFCVGLDCTQQNKHQREGAEFVLE